MRIIYDRKNNYIEIKGFTLLLLAAFFNDSLLIYGKAILGGLFGYNAFVNSFFPMLFVVLMVISLNQMKQHVHVQDILFVLFALLVIGASYLLYPENQEYYNEYNMNLLFTQAIPFFFLGLSACFDKKLLRTMTVLSWIAIIANVAYVFYFMQTRDMENDAMGWAYTALLPTMLSITGAFESNQKRDTVLGMLFSALGIVYILAMGTRGPIVIAFVYFAIMLWRKSQKKLITKRLLSLIIIIFVGIIVSGGHVVLLKSLRDILIQNGLSARTIDIFLQGEFISHTSGRDMLYATMQEQLKERPLLGFGTFGEWQFINYSAHNIWLQLCMHYGYVIGSLLLLAHMSITIRAYKKSKNPIAKSMIILFACFAYCRGVFGGDYLYYEFIFLLGLSLHEIRGAKCSSA